MTPGFDDRRATVRFRRRHPLAYQSESGELAHAATRDISETGLWVTTNSPPPAGTAVLLEVGFGDEVTQLRGVVTRVETADPSAGPNARVGFGVRLTWMPEGWKEIVAELARRNWNSR